MFEDSRNRKVLQIPINGGYWLGVQGSRMFYRIDLMNCRAYRENRKVGSTNCSKSEFLDPKEEQSVIGLKDCEIKGNLVGRGNADKVTCRNETDREDELFVRFELPLVITGWIIFLVTLGYLTYVTV